MRLGTETEKALWFALQQLDAALRLFNDSHTDDRCKADLKQAREAVMVACREHVTESHPIRKPSADGAQDSTQE